MTKKGTGMLFTNIDSRSLNALRTVAEKHLTAIKRYGKDYEEMVRDINDLIEASDRQIECCICGQMVYDKLSCNPYPVNLIERCCLECIDETVIPARLRQ